MRAAAALTIIYPTYAISIGEIKATMRVHSRWVINRRFLKIVAFFAFYYNKCKGKLYDYILLYI